NRELSVEIKAQKERSSSLETSVSHLNDQVKDLVTKNSKLSEEIEKERERKDAVKFELEGRKRRRFDVEMEMCQAMAIDQLAVSRDHFAIENDRLRAMIAWFTADWTVEDTGNFLDCCAIDESIEVEDVKPTRRQLQWMNASTIKTEPSCSLPSIDIPSMPFLPSIDAPSIPSWNPDDDF
ncbi:hypothetical protein PFISCL1PPCAC_6661, partial [Pristionchus fissidentatus]